ncbi:MAG: branched-chain amino acid ABC transporter permease [Spirochaetales bacterium]|uniref:Branched-chain amino acid ABC transporter permease n=1 Tax=Candidatus Thalassospirochaeta sargassi TaxID=3119039 RepID=A0AAJ1II42_9SPIO|nr:branched-chain amino acid ABC transporter permease [Spirochaetales bacterium]
MEIWITAIIYGLASSGILFLVSLALSIGYGLMRVVNMEAMVYYSFGAYVTYTIMSLTGSFILGALGGMLVGAGLGLLVETQLLRKIYNREMMFTMVVTFGVFMIGIGIIQFVWGLEPKPVASPISGIVKFFGGVQIPAYRLLIIVIAVIAYILIQLMMNKTIIGKALRAGIDNRENVEGLGVNINKIFTITFVVASAFAGLGGALNAPLVMVGPYMGFDMLLFAFITVILGGLGSIKGTMVAALILGQVINVGGTIWAPLATVGPFIVMFFTILIRPTGLFGKDI